MNPDEFFLKHPSLKGFGETNGWKVEDEFAESISMEDVARTQTDNAIIKEIIDDLHCCAGCLDCSCAVETTKKSFTELLKNKDVPRVVCVDDLKRAIEKVASRQSDVDSLVTIGRQNAMNDLENELRLGDDDKISYLSTIGSVEEEAIFGKGDDDGN